MWAFAADAANAQDPEGQGLNAQCPQARWLETEGPQERAAGLPGCDIDFGLSAGVARVVQHRSCAPPDIAILPLSGGWQRTSV